jgi:hypothetical protein
MTLDLLVDNDVIIKCACYSLLDELQHPARRAGAIGVLGAARFVVRGYLERRGRIVDRQAAMDRFNIFLPSVIQLEPTSDELALASLIEEAAVLAGVDLDGGESQLCAIAVYRASPVLLTGDKRAVSGAEVVLGDVAILSSLRGRLVCLEQAIAGIVERLGLAATRSVICAEPSVDRSLSICFECRNPNPRLESARDGLSSYVNHLRREAPTLLFAADAF